MGARDWLDRISLCQFAQPIHTANDEAVNTGKILAANQRCKHKPHNHKLQRVDLASVVAVVGKVIFEQIYEAGYLFVTVRYIVRRSHVEVMQKIWGRIYTAFWTDFL